MPWADLSWLTRPTDTYGVANAQRRESVGLGEGAESEQRCSAERKSRTWSDPGSRIPGMPSLNDRRGPGPRGSVDQLAELMVGQCPSARIVRVAHIRDSCAGHSLDEGCQIHGCPVERHGYNAAAGTLARHVRYPGKVPAVTSPGRSVAPTANLTSARARHCHCPPLPGPRRPQASQRVRRSIDGAAGQDMSRSGPAHPDLGAGLRAGTERISLRCNRIRSSAEAWLMWCSRAGHRGSSCQARPQA